MLIWWCWIKWSCHSVSLQKLNAATNLPKIKRHNIPFNENVFNHSLYLRHSWWNTSHSYIHTNSMTAWLNSTITKKKKSHQAHSKPARLFCVKKAKKWNQIWNVAVWNVYRPLISVQMIWQQNHTVRRVRLLALMMGSNSLNCHQRR